MGAHGRGSSRPACARRAPCRRARVGRGACGVRARAWRRCGARPVHGERPRPLHGGARFSESQQRLHGGTFVVDALFSGTTLDNGPNYLIDICLAEELVRRATAPLQQTHLDGDSTVLLKAAGVANATASGLAKALWTSIAQGLPPTHGLRGLKLVVAEHDASIAEYNGRLGHAPTLPTPTMRRALERRLMEMELPGARADGR